MCEKGSFQFFNLFKPRRPPAASVVIKSVKNRGKINQKKKYDELDCQLDF
jgi:hypothetical protein